MNSQEIPFYMGPNSDDDIRAIATGWFRYALHLRSGTIESADQYSRESYLGNLLLANAGMPAGTNRVLEMCPDVDRKAIIYRVYNSLNNHTIWSLSIETSTFTKVIQSSFLNFTSTDYGWSMFVTSGLLFWTTGIFTSYINSNFSEPKQLDINQAIAFTAGQPSEYVTISRQTFDFVKWPPPYGPTSAFSTDTNQEANFLWGKLYKFRYRYIYINNEETALSPTSRLALPVTGDFAQGRDWSNTQDDNIINVTIATGPDLVSKIEVLVSVNDGPWWVYDQIDKALEGVSDNTTYVSVFRGNEALLPTSLVQINYDNVPQTSRNMAFLPSRQIAFGDYVEGYNKQATAATIEAIPVEIIGKQFPITSAFYGYDPLNAPNTSFITPGNPAVVGVDVYVQVGDTMPFVCGGTVPSQVITYVVNQADYDQIYAQPTAALRRDEFLTIVGTFIETELSIAAGGLATVAGFRVYQWNFQIFTNTINGNANPQISYFSQIKGGTYRLSDPHVGLFKGAIHEYGKQYYDRANRDGTVLTSTALKLYVPFDTEQDKSDFLNVNDPFFTYARTTDSDIPPDWATHMQWVKRKVPVVAFRETTGINIYNDPNNSSLLIIELESFLVTKLNGSYSDNINVGDIVRLIRQGTSTATIGQYIVEATTLQVMKYDPSAGPGGSIWVPAFDSTGVVVNSSGFVLQIYTPAKLDENAVWNEIGEEYAIISPHTTSRRHTGSTVTGTATSLATGMATFDLEASMVGPNGGNFEYLIGRVFNITADVSYTGTIIGAAFNPATQTTAITANTNFTGIQTTGTIVIDLSQTLASSAYVTITYTGLAGGVFAPGDTVTDTTTGATGTIITISTNSMTVVYTSTGLAFTPTNIVDNGSGVTATIATVTNAGLQAIVNMAFGDVYTRTRAMTATPGANGLARFYTIDDFALSDFYPSAVNSTGRPAIELPDARQIRQRATIEHGGSYIDGSQINNLCRFDITDLTAVLAMNQMYGPINKMIMMDGYTLKCIQDKKENSVYITATFGVLPDGAEQTGFDVNKTFAGWRPMGSLAGTIHPYSVQVIENRLYYFDYYQGTMIRSSNNGQENIAEGKFKYKNRINEFKIGIDTIGLTNSWVTSSVDEQNNEYTITLFDVSAPTIGRQGLVFRYDLNKWDHEVSYAMFFACNNGNYLISTPALLSTVYRHGAGTLNSFYGTTYSSELSFAFNGEPGLIKRLLAIGLKTNQAWSVTHVFIEASGSYTSMDSSIGSNLFEALEDYYWAKFLNDSTNIVATIPSIANATLALQNGRQLRGYAANVVINYLPTSNPSSDVKIFSAKINYELSNPRL